MNIKEIIEIAGNLGSFAEGLCSCLNILAIGALFISIIGLNNQRNEAKDQIMLSTSATYSSSYQEMTQTMIQIDLLFVENHHLIKYFYASKEFESTDNNYSQIMTVAETMIDHWDMIMVLKATMPKDVMPRRNIEVYNSHWERWTLYMEERYKNSHAIREYWSKNKDFYSPELNQVLNKFKNEYMEQEKQKNTA